MKFMKTLAIPCVLAILAPMAQATVVPQQYTAFVQSVVSPSGTAMVGSQPITAGDRLTGVFAYDDALTGQPGSPWDLLPYELGYRGTVQDNHATAILNGGTVLVAPPAANASNCSFFEPLCTSLPLVLKRSAGPTLAGQPTDILSLRYDVPANGFGSTALSGPARVSSIELMFFYSSELPGDALPAQIKLEDLRLGQVVLNLSDGAGVFARIESIAPAAAVPEPQSWAMMLVGLGLIGLARTRRGGSTPAEPSTNLRRDE